MNLEWRNAEKTILARIDGNHTDIIEPMMAEWAELSQQDGIAPFVPPEPAPVVDLRAGMVASRFQVRAALLMAGLLDQVEAAVAQADPLTRMAWAEAVDFRRNSPTIARLAEGLGLDAKTLDDLFAAAIQIEI